MRGGNRTNAVIPKILQHFEPLLASRRTSAACALLWRNCSDWTDTNEQPYGVEIALLKEYD
jgi:hypothetical protein